MTQNTPLLRIRAITGSRTREKKDNRAGNAGSILNSGIQLNNSELMRSKRGPHPYDLEAFPRCCVDCFADKNTRRFINRYGQLGDCEFCMAADVMTVGAVALADRLTDDLAVYEHVEDGTHYIRQLEDPDGESLDELFAQDNPGFFSDRLEPEERERLVQTIVNQIDSSEIWEGFPGREVSDYWTRPGNEIWAGREDEPFFYEPPARWQAFVREITSRKRFLRLDSEIDPRTYLTDALLRKLSRKLKEGTVLYRAAIGGVNDRRGLQPYQAARMAGPGPEHCRRGQRVNPAGIPMLYAALKPSTAIAEVRPWVGAPISVATLSTAHPLRLINFCPRRRRQNSAASEMDAIITTIGEAMARPVDPDESEIRYAPTQYVAEVVETAGYDGVMFSSAVSNGINVVLFDKQNAQVSEVDLYKVQQVSHRFALHMNPAIPTLGSEEDLDIDF